MRVKVLLCLMLLFGCDQTENEKDTGNRIVSLSPGITATISDLGLNNLVVGRSAFCKTVDKSVPVVGDIYKVDYERLLRLNPSYVFVQETSGDLDSHLKELASQGNFTLISWRVDRIVDIQQLHDELVELFCIDKPPFELAIERSNQKFPSPILIMTLGSEGASGLCFGQDTYLNDILEIIGCVNAIHSSGWLSLSLEDIAKLNPELILVVSDTKMPISNGIHTLDIPVIEFIHKDVLIPSSKIVNVAVKLQEKLESQ
jgi:ABC-type hemin transport system substrate-binding protein